MSPELAIGLVVDYGTFGGVLAIGVILFFVERRLLAVERELDRIRNDE